MTGQTSVTNGPRYQRLNGGQIGLLRFLAIRCGLGGAVRLDRWRRGIAVSLWRRGLVEVWCRQAVEASLQGPYFGLSIVGRRVALAFTMPRSPKTTGA